MGEDGHPIAGPSPRSVDPSSQPNTPMTETLVALDDPPIAEPSPTGTDPDAAEHTDRDPTAAPESPVPKLDTTRRLPRETIECKECEGRGVVVELLQRWDKIERLKYPCTSCNGRGFTKCRYPRGCDARWPNTFGTRSWRWSRSDWDKKPRLSWRWRGGEDLETPVVAARTSTYPPASTKPSRRRSTAAVQATLNRLDEIGIIPAGIELPAGGSAGVLLVTPNVHLDHRAVPLRSLQSTRLRLETPNGSPGWHPPSRSFAPPSLPVVHAQQATRVREPGLEPARAHTVCHGGVEHSNGMVGPGYSQRSDGSYFKPTSAQMVRDPWFAKLGPRGVAGFHKTIAHLNVRNP